MRGRSAEKKLREEQRREEKSEKKEDPSAGTVGESRNIGSRESKGRLANRAGCGGIGRHGGSGPNVFWSESATSYLHQAVARERLGLCPRLWLF